MAYYQRNKHNAPGRGTEGREFKSRHSPEFLNHLRAPWDSPRPSSGPFLVSIALVSCTIHYGALLALN